MTADKDYQSTELVAHLAKHGYATIEVYGEPEIRVYVPPNVDAGGELKACLSQFGYAPTYLRSYDGDDFEMVVECEPILWNQTAIKHCPTPSWWDEKKDDLLGDDK